MNEPPDTSSRALRLLLGGDVMLGRGVNKRIRKLGPGYPLDPLRPITRDADLFMVNLECAISAEDTRYKGPPKPFYFRADPIAAEVLRRAGVDLVNLANNHALDAGVEGLGDTIEILDAFEIAHVGAGRDLAAARRAVILEAQGRRVGVLGACDHQADFAAGLRRPGIHYVGAARPSAVDELARCVTAVAKHVDHVIVSMHWMPNWLDRPPEAYHAWGRQLIDAGARVVWGHSPHHFLGVEYRGPGAILYAAGDLLDDYAVKPHYRNDLQLLFELHLSSNAVERIIAHPLRLRFARTIPAADEDADWIARRFTRQCAAYGTGITREPDRLIAARS